MYIICIRLKILYAYFIIRLIYHYCQELLSLPYLHEFGYTTIGHYSFELWLKWVNIFKKITWPTNFVKNKRGAIYIIWRKQSSYGPHGVRTYSLNDIEIEVSEILCGLKRTYYQKWKNQGLGLRHIRVILHLRPQSSRYIVRARSVFANPIYRKKNLCIRICGVGVVHNIYICQ